MPTTAKPGAADEAVWEGTPVLVRPAYGIDERPAAWWEAVLYGWQHTLVDISPFVLPLAVGAALGMAAGEQARFINDCLLAMGIATLIQTTVGNRLPIVQGPSATLTGALVPIAGSMGGPAMWGGIFAGALLEMLVGASRVLGFLRRLFPPAVSGVVVIAIALALGQFAVRLAVGDGGAANFAWAGGVIAVIALLQTVFRRAGRGIVGRGAIFLAIWAVGLGVGSLAGAVDWSLVAAKPWLGPPRFFPYGGPGFGWTLVPAAVARRRRRLPGLDRRVAGRLRRHLRGLRRDLPGPPHEPGDLRRGAGLRGGGLPRRPAGDQLHPEHRHHRHHRGRQPFRGADRRRGADPLRALPEVRGAAGGDAAGGARRGVRPRLRDDRDVRHPADRRRQRHRHRAAPTAPTRWSSAPP